MERLWRRPEIKQALDQIAGGYFSADAPDRFRPVVDALYRDPDEWTRRAILNIAGMGKFSSDRAVLEYAKSIWNVNPVRH